MYLSEWQFFHSPLKSTLPLARCASEYCHEVWCGKTIEWCGYQVVKSFMIYLAVATEYHRVTDWRTDEQTDILLEHSPHYA